MWGALATGIFVTIGSNLPGLIDGGAAQFLLQVLGVVVAILIAGIGTFIIASIITLIQGPMRASEREETLGLDLTQHGERGFQLY